MSVAIVAMTDPTASINKDIPFPGHRLSSRTDSPTSGTTSSGTEYLFLQQKVQVPVRTRPLAHFSASIFQCYSTVCSGTNM
ncbi:hypothetical protein JTB14_012072 [Gonioctena quinquepunctata]|nr:hypothetical protein JTB14_012072 [Gonioctena quinquepunctata]